MRARRWAYVRRVPVEGSVLRRNTGLGRTERVWRLLGPVRRRAETEREGLWSLRAWVGVVVEKEVVWDEMKLGRRNESGVVEERCNAGPKAPLRRALDVQCIARCRVRMGRIR